MNKIIKLVIGLLVVLCLTLLYFIYLQLPRATYKLQNEPKLLTPEVKAGDELVWLNDICKLHDKDFYSERVLKRLDNKREFPSLDTPILNAQTPLQKGECRMSEVRQVIPENQPVGEYELITRIFVKQNSRSTDKFEYTIGPFTIK